jgi:RNA-binding protein
MAVLESFQKQYLKGLAHPLKPVVQVGASSLTEGVFKAVQEALETHELVKVRLAKPEDKQAMAQSLAEHTESHLVALLGHTVVLYKRRKKDPRIVLPTRVAR